MSSRMSLVTYETRDGTRVNVAPDDNHTMTVLPPLAESGNLSRRGSGSTTSTDSKAEPTLVVKYVDRHGQEHSIFTGDMGQASRKRGWFGFFGGN